MAASIRRTAAAPVSRESNPIVPQIPHMQARSHPKMRDKLCESAAGCEPNAHPAVSHRTNARIHAIKSEKLPAAKMQSWPRTIRVRQAESWLACLPIREPHDRVFVEGLIRTRECAPVGYVRCDRRYSLVRSREY